TMRSDLSLPPTTPTQTQDTQIEVFYYSFPKLSRSLFRNYKSPLTKINNKKKQQQQLSSTSDMQFSTLLAVVTALASTAAAAPPASKRSYTPGRCGIHIWQRTQRNNADSVTFEVKDGEGIKIGWSEGVSWPTTHPPP